MFRDGSCLRLADGLSMELSQSRDEGKEVEGFRPDVQRIEAMDPGDPMREEMAAALYRTLAGLPPCPGYPYQEPSDLEGIRATLPQGFPEAAEAEGELLYDKVYGAWLGRCAGCLLGQPIEGWRRARIAGFLEETRNQAVRGYLSSLQPHVIREKYGVEDVADAYCSWYNNWINNVDCAPEDDDTNYSVLALRLLETRGRRFTPENVAELWLSSVPLLRTCTAERVAYRNMARLIMPPASATHENPYREGIGAQIRADVYGYVTPGNPAEAAELAWRDACVSHVKNGIYGAMFTAAMISAAAAEGEQARIDPARIIAAGLRQVPPRSRLVEGVRKVLSWAAEGIRLDGAIDLLHSLKDERDPHVGLSAVTNSMVVALAVLYGAMDLPRTLAAAIRCAFDTDCNAATAGSIVGMARGAGALPAGWTAPLNDTLRTGISGIEKVRISELARRTCAVARERSK